MKAQQAMNWKVIVVTIILFLALWLWKVAVFVAIVWVVWQILKFVVNFFWDYHDGKYS